MRFFLLFFFISISHAQILVPSRITHGGEIEFTNEWIYQADGPDKIGKLRGREYPAAKAMAVIVRSKCRSHGCQVLEVEGKWGPEFHVQMDDGWWFRISYDPLCIEIQTAPATVPELYKKQTVMEELIFASAREAGFEATANRSTHMNTGARSAFGYDVRSLFNYFVDNANNPELSTGIFRNNWDTSPPLIASHDDAGPIIKGIQNQIEKKKIKTFAELSLVVEAALHSILINPRFNPARNQDLTLRKLKTLRRRSWFSIFSEQDMPIERRAVRAVRSFKEFILHAELIEARIAWVKTQPGFITFKNKKQQQMLAVDRQDYFENWLKEMNVVPDRYRDLIKISAPTAPKLKSQKNSCYIFYAG